MSLTDTAIRNVKPLDKSLKLSDAQGLYLLITPNGSKLWQLKYRFGGKEKKLAFGAYPAISLANAHKIREETRSVLSVGYDPGVKKRKEKTRFSSTILFVVFPYPRIKFQRATLPGPESLSS
ncbi:DUF4102 domain-containing protein [Citrobacter farmeri]|nr:DUF4102 domain-containing protein [Citrobacter farmeri]